MVKDGTLANPTADDPNSTAHNAARFARESDAEVKKLEAQRARLQSFGGASSKVASPEFEARRKKQLAEVESQLAVERGELERRKADALAQSVLQRNEARGTGANDDILSQLTSLQGSGSARGAAEQAFRQSETIKTFAPELAGASSTTLDRIAAIMEKTLAEQQRQSAIIERAQATQFSAPERPGGAMAPQGARRPK